MTLDIDAARLAELISDTEAVAAIRQALADFDPAGDFPRSAVNLAHGQFLLMPSEVGGFVGVKVATVTPLNPAAGLPRIQAQYLLYDGLTHRLLATIDGTALTALRTPAVSVAVVGDALRQRFPDGARVLLYGAGPQAVSHLRILSSVIGVERAVFAVRNPLPYQGLPSELALDHPVEVVSADAADPASADVIIAATTAAEPVFDGSRVHDRAVVVAVGSHEPDKRELGGKLLGRSTVVVEAESVALTECGDVVLAVAEGHLATSALVSAKTLVAQGPPAAGPLVFKSAGMSWEDLAVAIAVYRRAVG